MEIHWKLFEPRIRDDVQDGEAYTNERPREREAARIFVLKCRSIKSTESHPLDTLVTIPSFLMSCAFFISEHAIMVLARILRIPVAVNFFMTPFIAFLFLSLFLRIK